MLILYLIVMRNEYKLCNVQNKRGINGQIHILQIIIKICQIKEQAQMGVHQINATNANGYATN